jgi:hypothetical protein
MKLRTSQHSPRNVPVRHYGVSIVDTFILPSPDDAVTQVAHWFAIAQSTANAGLRCPPSSNIQFKPLPQTCKNTDHGASGTYGGKEECIQSFGGET